MQQQTTKTLAEYEKTLQQRSHLHQEESGKYQTEIQQLKDMLEQRSHLHQEESGKYQTEIQQLKDTLQQRSHLHQEESARYQTEIQSLQEALEQSETKELDVTPSNAKATLLRAFNQIQIEDRVLPAQSSNPIKDKTDIARLESIISLLRQNVANKTNQISELESRLNEVFSQLQSYQQRSYIHQEESVKYQTEIQQLKQAQNLDILNRPIDTTKPSDQATKHELIRLFNPH